MVHLYLEPDAGEQHRDALMDAWRARFGDRIWAFTRDEAVAAGLFGDVRPDVAGRIGDVMIAARDALALYDTRRVRPTALEVVGQHGSLTKAEREVPLLCFQAKAERERVAELVFFSGTMDCGKSTLALQMDHNHRARGRGGVRFSRNDRAGGSRISSRLGLETDASRS